jgi:hypothetical protein
VYGSAISYVTGKVEAYLRCKEIAYHRIPITPFVQTKVGRRIGTTQMPALVRGRHASARGERRDVGDHV